MSTKKRFTVSSENSLSVEILSNNAIHSVKVL